MRLGLAARLPPVADPCASVAPPQPFVSATRQPVAVRGGVMLLPLVRCAADAPWPESMALSLGDGRTLRGTAAVVRRRPASPRAHWTSPMVSVGADPAAEAKPGEDVVLLVPVPEDGADHVMLGAQRIEPDWIDPLPAARSPAAGAPQEGAPHLPDLDAPSEHFRWVLLAARVGEPVPDPRGSACDALYARHLASLWSGALERLRQLDPDLAREALMDLCGRACVPEGSCIAAWATDLAELNSLLESLLDPGADGIAVADAARRWLERRPPVVAWVDGEDDAGVALRIANPRTASVEVAVRWPDRKDAAATVQVGPESVETVRVARDSAQAPEVSEELVQVLEEHDLGHLAPPQPDAQREAVRRAVERSARAIPSLVVESGAWSLQVPAGTGIVAARPPSLSLGQLLPAASLCEVRAGTVRSVPESLLTSAQLRRRPAGWEVLIDCARPAEASAEDIVSLAVDAGWRHEIRLSESGAIGDTGGAEVRIASGPARWRARISMPPEWVRAPQGTITLERRLADGQVLCAGMAPVAWDPHARPVPVSFDAWTPAPAPAAAPGATAVPAASADTLGP